MAGWSDQGLVDEAALIANDASAATINPRRNESAHPVRRNARESLWLVSLRF